MENPFPGVNPYMEQNFQWQGFHNNFLMQMEGILNANLPAEFAAYYEERVYIIPPNSISVPDMMIVPKQAKKDQRHGGTALLERTAPSGIVSIPDEVRESYIAIRTVEKGEAVVTVIELLSPSNKTSGKGRKEYLKKQNELLQSDTHLLEIDLLKQGLHTVATPERVLKNQGKWDYLISLRRVSFERHFEFWVNQLNESLPLVGIPLTDGYPDFVLDLQNIFNAAYKVGPYSRRLDYNTEPSILLSKEERVWMDKLLKEKGLRTA